MPFLSVAHDPVAWVRARESSAEARYAPEPADTWGCATSLWLYALAFGGARVPEPWPGMPAPPPRFYSGLPWDGWVLTWSGDGSDSATASGIDLAVGRPGPYCARYPCSPPHRGR